MLFIYKVMNHIDIEIEVKKIVSKQTGYNFKQLSLKTDLSRDLGVDGDDAMELLENFSQEFQVDMSEFEFERYFGWEAGADPFALIAMLFLSSNSKLEPLTIQDLINAAVSKKWLKA